ncbi:HdeD family acid-resistance protein [Streptomyces sp. SP18CS02]|uniref:HdeD family acid-resistance protein n=1 Tax=Streptomyces sp. SP18CS02 TaxID=3002531 RepID=UPI002E75A35C|nr:DUF308 domain-containing protein [Streptomyces sp. SP18CS02]MEE1757201.1 DUF308 domain-containing protein [Streptomyces sp. SP18CS02]
MAMPRGSAPPSGPESVPGPPTGPAGDPAGTLAIVGRSWLWILGAAVATLAPGVLILVWPDETLHVLAVLLGLNLLVTGCFRFVSSFARREHADRLAGLLVAVLFVLAGVLCLRHPLQTVTALSLLVGIVWLVSGVVTLHSGLATADLPHRGLVIAAGVLGIVAGIVVLALPAESAHALIRLLGLWLVLLGLFELVLALAWRAALRGSRAPAPPGPGTAA